MKRQANAASLVLAALVTLALVVLVENAIVAALFARPARLPIDFSAASLRADLDAVAAAKGATVLFGDSVLWGYRLPQGATAAARLSARGADVRNLAFKAGSPPNDYAIARLLLARGFRPRAVVLEIDQKTLNEADAAYAKLHPAVAELAYRLLAPGDRTLLDLSAPPAGAPAALDHALASVSLVYAMRADVRERLFGERDAAPPVPTSADAYEGTYDLARLGPSNVGVHFLSETLDALTAAHVPVLAFLTPTNHALLHAYIDNPQYRANAAYLKALAERRGVRVLDLDARFPASEFIDNVHLTAAGQRRLAAALAAQLAR